jgi:RimJ/RimL family protein N-acetyltransferase
MDATLLFQRAYGNSEFMRLYRLNDVPETPEQLLVRLQRRWNTPLQRAKSAEMLVVHKQHGPIGIAALVDYHPLHGSAEYLIGLFEPEQRGVGHGIETTLMVMDLAFNHFRLHKLNAFTYGYNDAGRSNLLGGGFVDEGLRREHLYSKAEQRYIDLQAYGLIESDFRKNHLLAKLSRRLLGHDITREPDRSVPALRTPPGTPMGTARRVAVQHPKRNILPLAVSIALGKGSVHAATYNVTQATDDGSGDVANTLSWAIRQANLNAGADTITLGTDVTFTDVQRRLIDSDITLESDGTRRTISGDSTHRPLFVLSGNVVIRNLDITQGRARGGGSETGGAGAGLGGGLFVYSGTVTVSNVDFSDNHAAGGSTLEPLPSFVYTGGPGGGMAGGGGFNGDASSKDGPNQGGGLFSGYYGGTGDYGGYAGAEAGDPGGFGGGGNYGKLEGTSGGFGGGGGPAGVFLPPLLSVGGSGGFGGGGGEAAWGFVAAVGGNGGFGGGGGVGGKNIYVDQATYDEYIGDVPEEDRPDCGDPPFYYTFPASGGYGGFGGGDGNPVAYGCGQIDIGSYRGGGGAGFGGAVFVKKGTLSLRQVSFNGNTATGGTGFNDGEGRGGALFLCTAAESGDDADGNPICDATLVDSCDVSFNGNSTDTGEPDAFGDITGIEAVCLDTTPDPFTFLDYVDVVPNTSQQSNEIVVTGINALTPISVVGGRYSIDYTALTDLPGLVNPDDKVVVVHTASANFSTSTHTTLTIGGVSDTFTTTTQAEDTTPDPFSFTDQSDVPLASPAISNTIWVSGINSATAISVTGGEYNINGAAYTSTAGTVNLGDSVTVRHTSSANFASNTDTVLAIGGINDTFTTTTLAGSTSSTQGTATDTGSATLSFSGGGENCGYTHTEWIPLEGHPASPPAGSAPAGVMFPHGLFDFIVGGGCTPGTTFNFTLTLPAPMIGRSSYWKYGPTESDTTPHWYELPAEFSGDTVSFSITDGGLGDDDLSANGEIVDQGGPGVLAAAGGGSAVATVPTLSQWGQLLLGVLLGGLGLLGLRRGKFL